jgi:hypothetical protein
MRPCLLILALASLLFVHGCKRVMLDERFHDARLSNWTVIDDPACVEIPSDWRVGKDGWLRQESNIWGRRGDFIGRWYGTLIVAGREDWSDYRLSLKARAHDDDGFGVVFRFLDAEHFYRLLFLNDGFSGGPITRLDRREGAEYTELWSAPRGYKLEAEMMIEVVLSGDTIRASVDGQPLLEVKDGSYTRGKIGLFCYAQNGQAFDEVKVESQ